MKHKLLQSLMLIAALLTSAHAHAHDFEAKNSDGVTIYYNITSSTDKTCEVTFRGGYSNSYLNEYMGSIVIPETVTYNGTTYSVTSIREYAFHGCDLTSVTIPNGVTSIGSRAFEYCYKLTSVNISDLEAWCNIYFGGSSANPLYYAKKLYLNGELLTGLVIPDSIIVIKQYAFYNCTGLTSVTIPNSVTCIGYSAFCDCI